MCLKFKVILFSLTVFFLGSLFISPFARAREVTKVIAKVNNQVITSRDLDDFCKILAYRLSEDDGEFSCGDEKFKGEAFEKFIEDKLVLDEAEKSGINIPAPWISNKLRQMISMHSSREEFERSLIEKGLNMTLIKEKIKEQFLMREIIQKYVKSLISISPQQISGYYSLHQEQFRFLPSFIFHIAKSDDKTVLEEISAVIGKEGFTAALKRYNRVLLEIESSKDELKEGIAVILEKLEKGKWVIEEIDGEFCLVYLKDITASGVAPLENVKKRIHTYLWNIEFKKRYSEWVEGLREKAVIKKYYE